MSKNDENSQNTNSFEKRKLEKKELDDNINKQPKSKLKIRESLSEKDKREKFYTCNSNEVVFFKIGKMKK